jgi:hypothetical protein
MRLLCLSKAHASEAVGAGLACTFLGLTVRHNICSLLPSDVHSSDGQPLPDQAVADVLLQDTTSHSFHRALRTSTVATSHIEAMELSQLIARHVGPLLSPEQSRSQESWWRSAEGTCLRTLMLLCDRKAGSSERPFVRLEDIADADSSCYLSRMTETGVAALGRMAKSCLPAPTALQ